jgi:cytochrome c553
MWTGIVVAGIVGIALLGVAWIFFASERELDRKFAAAESAPLVIPTAAADIAEGERIAQLAGCQHCHGDMLAGALVEDIPNLVRLVASNASVKLPEYSDTQLVTMLRRGVKPDGTSVMFMPSEMFRHLSDQELARLIAWLRTMPATAEGVQEETQVRIIGRMLLAKGDFKTAAEAIESLPPAATSFDADDSVSRGRHLTMSFCSECHGQQLEGFAPINAPALAVAKNYSLEQFTRLMHEGKALGDRETRLMSPTSRVRFSKFTPDEVAAVHAFLQTL